MSEKFAPNASQTSHGRSLNLLRDDNPQTQRRVVAEKLDQCVKLAQLGEAEELESLLREIYFPMADLMDHKIDAVRESAAKVMQMAVSRMTLTDQQFEYVVQKLVERTNCFNLDSFDHLAEEQRPTPSSLPTVVVTKAEQVEEIRFQLLELLREILQCSPRPPIVRHLSDITNILRMFLMDPELSIQVAACQTAADFISDYREELIHFTDRIARSLLLSLVSQKSRVRLAALRTLEQLLFVGPWKQSYAVMDLLIGFQDPNSVAIKDFYESSMRVNYLALLIGDSKRQVREAFLNVLENWFMNLKDREDHFPRMLPYLLTFLFDPDEDLRSQAVDVFEEMGRQIEREKEGKFRGAKQSGIDSEWLSVVRPGKAGADFLGFGPFRTRPRIGTRFLVQTNSSKLIPAIKRELKDSINEANRLRALQLLGFLIFLGEENVAEFVPGILVNFVRNLKLDKSESVLKEIKTCCRLIGRFCRFENIFVQIRGFLEEGSPSDPNFRPAVVILTAFLEGHFWAEAAAGEKTAELNLGSRKCDFEVVVGFLKDLDPQLADGCVGEKEFDGLLSLVTEIGRAIFGFSGNDETEVELGLAHLGLKMAAHRLWLHVHKADSKTPEPQTDKNPEKVKHQLASLQALVARLQEAPSKSDSRRQLTLLGFSLAVSLPSDSLIVTFIDKIIHEFEITARFSVQFYPIHVFVGQKIQSLRKSVDFPTISGAAQKSFEISSRMAHQSLKESEANQLPVLSTHLEITKAIIRATKTPPPTAAPYLSQGLTDLLKPLTEALSNTRSPAFVVLMNKYLKVVWGDSMTAPQETMATNVIFAKVLWPKLLFVDENSTDFGELLSSALCVFGLLSKATQLPNEVVPILKDLVDEALRVSWSLQTAELRLKTQAGLATFLKKHPLLLTEMIQESEKEGRLRKLEFLTGTFQELIK